MREPLAGVRLRADFDAEIASENRAISRIEEAIDNYVPPRCSFCTAWAVFTCPICDRPCCEDDGRDATNLCVDCWDELP